MSTAGHDDALHRGYTRWIDGQAVDLFTLRNAGGMTARLTNHGARLVQLTAPDRHGRLDDVVLGYDTLDALRAGHVSAGATIGRYAGRIRDARFTLDGTRHRLSANDGAHHLHGGKCGSRHKVFHAVQRGPDAVRFATTFADGEDGYPGRCALSVDFTLSSDSGVWRRSTNCETAISR